MLRRTGPIVRRSMDNDSDPAQRVALLANFTRTFTDVPDHHADAATPSGLLECVTRGAAASATHSEEKRRRTYDETIDLPTLRCVCPKCGARQGRHALMGHANVNVDTTLNVYTQVLDGSVRDAVEKIGGELFAIVHRPEQAGALTD